MFDFERQFDWGGWEGVTVKAKAKVVAKKPAPAKPAAPKVVAKAPAPKVVAKAPAPKAPAPKAPAPKAPAPKAAVKISAVAKPTTGVSTKPPSAASVAQLKASVTAPKPPAPKKAAAPKAPVVKASVKVTAKVPPAPKAPAVKKPAVKVKATVSASAPKAAVKKPAVKAKVAVKATTPKKAGSLSLTGSVLGKASVKAKAPKAKAKAKLPSLNAKPAINIKAAIKVPAAMAVAKHAQLTPETFAQADEASSMAAKGVIALARKGRLKLPNKLTDPAKAAEVIAPLANTCDCKTKPVLDMTRAKVVAAGFPISATDSLLAQVSDMNKAVEKAALQRIATSEHNKIDSSKDFKRSILAKLAIIANKLPPCHPTRSRAYLRILRSGADCASV